MEVRFMKVKSVRVVLSLLAAVLIATAGCAVNPGQDSQKDQKTALNKQDTVSGYVNVSLSGYAYDGVTSNKIMGMQITSSLGNATADANGYLSISGKVPYGTQGYIYISAGLYYDTYYFDGTTDVNFTGPFYLWRWYAAAPVSMGQLATASSSQANHPAADANDYESSSPTRWAASSSRYPQTWTVDLGMDYYLDSMQINWYNNDSRSYQYKIGVSEDGNTFQTILDRTRNTNRGITSDSLSGFNRYVRVTITGCSDHDGYASMWDCSIIGH
jgi:F5/8 type C domain